MLIRFFLIFTLLMLTACGVSEFSYAPSKNGEQKSEKLVIAVSIAPLEFLVSEVGGARVRAEVMVPSGREPENFQPSPELIKRLAHSTILFRLGFSFESSLIPKLPHSAARRVIDLRASLDLHRATLTHDSHSHSDGSMCVDESGCDNHVWLSPILCEKIVAVIADTLAQHDTAHAEEYHNRGEQLAARFRECQTRLAEKLAPHAGETILVFHPAYRYFCDAFELKQYALEFEGRAPRPQQIIAWVNAATRAAEERATRSGKAPTSPLILVQPEFSHTAAAALAETTRGTLVSHSPLTRDIFACLDALAEAITAHK